MAITTYSTLLTAVETWLDDNQFSAYASDFVSLGENRIKRELRNSNMEARATATLSTTSRYLALPSGFVGFRRFQLNTATISNLEFVSQDQMELYRQSTSGQPKRYTIAANQIEFDRTPDSAYTGEINYYKLTDLAVTSNETNELMPEFADLYLYASLCEGGAFLQEDTTVWENKYQIALSGATRADTFKKYPEGKLRVRLDFNPE
jgi:hypothetical protein